MFRFISANPFLTAGLTGTLAFAVWLALGLDIGDRAAGQALFHLWRVLAAPVHLAANLLSPYTDRLPNVLDAGAAVLVGLGVHALADLLWRHARRSRHRRSQGAP